MAKGKSKPGRGAKKPKKGKIAAAGKKGPTKSHAKSNIQRQMSGEGG